MTEIRDKLAKELETVDWNALAVHHKNERVIEVNRSLSILEVGVSIAEDQADIVAKWIEDGLICRPDTQKVLSWQSSNKSFQLLIVQPYVLVQETTLDS